MKKRFFLLFLVVGLFSACQQNVFLPKPNVNPDSGRADSTDTEWHAPKELSATQGAKRTVTLKWKTVKDAVRYNIYRAENEFDSFIQVGETKGIECNFEIKAEPGFDMYYRVSAVDATGKESDMSNIERATTLSKPMINSIEGKNDMADSDVYVSWYMNNVDAYVDSVYYNVICFDESKKEVQRQNSKGAETTVLFTGLNPNTNYFYKVEAYNGANEFEESDILDAATARRLCPAAATDLVVEQGISKDSISVSFKLPDFVDVTVGKNLYEPTPIYFKIYRREYKEVENKDVVDKDANNKDDANKDTANKVAEENKDDVNKDTEGKEPENKNPEIKDPANKVPENKEPENKLPENNEPFILIKDDFGVYKPEGKVDYTKVNFGKEPGDYVPGEVVTYVDKFNLKPGVKYEYKVQSFAYTKKEISSDRSIVQSEKPGWLLPEFSFKTKRVEYKFDEAQSVKTEATLKFDFTMDTLGSPYKFKITEIKNEISKGPDGEGVETEVLDFDSIKKVIDYERKFNFTQKNESGYYRYKLTILSDKDVELASVMADGFSTVTDSMETPKIGEVRVTTGYTDRIELGWDWNPVYEYTLEYWDDGAKHVKVPNVDLLNNNDGKVNNFIYKDLTAKAGVKRNYILTASGSDGIRTSSSIMDGMIPEKPKLSVNYAYDKISFSIDNFDDKDNYDLVTKFEDDTLNSSYNINLSEGAVTPSSKEYTCEIISKESAPEGDKSIDAAMAGVKINIEVTRVPLISTKKYIDAEGLKEKLIPNFLVSNSETAPNEGESTQKLTSNIVTAYVGPALLNQTASQGTYADNITVTWDKVIGADSYVIFRDRYHIGRSGKKDDLELQNSTSDKYIVTLNEDGKTVTVKCDDAEMGDSLGDYVSVQYDAETGKFTLNDKYRQKMDTDAGNQWRAGQAEITWGAPNKYTVIPVLSVEDGINSSKDEKNIISINETKIKNPKNVLGGTKGYGWNVTATKGTYVSDRSASEKRNDAVEIKWTEPYFGANDRIYAIFRKESVTPNSEWKKIGVTTSLDAIYIDSNINQGTVYEYTVVEKDSGVQSPDVNFIAKQNLGENGTVLDNSKGFILPKPEISAVSREDLSIKYNKPELQYCEEVTFITDTNINNMINGYVIQVRNNNIDDKWHDIKDVPITNDNKRSDTFIEIVNNLDLLKVLRDYKHYYRIRAYTTVGGEKIYSKPDETPFKNDMDTVYVKWGCRQISIDEFAKAAIIGMSTGMEKERGNRGCNNNGDGITGLKSTSKYNAAIWDTDFTITFSYKDYVANHKSKGLSEDVNAVSINGNLYARGGLLNAWQKHYWTTTPISVTYNGNNQIGTISFKGTNSKGAEAVNRTVGVIEVTWNGVTKPKTYNMGDNTGNAIKPLPFPCGEGYLNNNPEWQ